MAERYDFYVHDNRKITFNLTEPIMREDSGVTDFVFYIPKVLNGLEVSDWSWWLVFVNAKKEKYSIALTLSEDPERPLEFNIATYTVDYAMSIKAGAVQFALEAINAGTGGAIDNEWHTLTYETKVKETLQGNQAEYAETESDIISELLIEVRNKANQLVGGATPLPMSTVAGMTDQTKIYLYTGSETGYTAGNWYYHNGSAWVSGGVYGAGVVDSVPTQGSTNAVSSGGVYSALQVVGDNFFTQSYAGSFDWVLGTLGPANGVDQTSMTRMRSKFVPVGKGTQILSSASFANLCIYAYDKDFAFVPSASVTTWTKNPYRATVDGYVKILVRKSASNSTITSDDFESLGATFTIAPYHLPQLRTNGYDSRIAVFERLLVDDRLLTNCNFQNVLKWEKGSIDGSTGQPNTGNRIRTEEFSIPIQIAKFTPSVETGYKYVVDQYDNGAFTSASSWKTVHEEFLNAENRTFRILLAKTDDSTIDVTEYVNFSVYGESPVYSSILDSTNVDSIAAGCVFERKTLNGTTHQFAGTTTRIAVTTPMLAEKDLYINVKDGYKLTVSLWSDSSGEASTWMSSTSWLTDRHKIEEGSYYTVLCAKTDNSEILPAEGSNLYYEAIPTVESFIKLEDKIGEKVYFNSTPICVEAANVDTKVKDYTALINDSGIGEAFLFFSDPHLMGNDGTFDGTVFKQYIGTVQKAYNQIPASFIVCGGDWLNSRDTQEEACNKLGFVDGVMKSMFHDYYPILGNHDTNYQGYVSDSDTSRGDLTQQTMVNLFFRKFKKAYYSFDGDNTKFYVFDTGTDWESSMTAYRWEQVDWFARKLIEDDAEYSAVMLHIGFSDITDFDPTAFAPLATNIGSVITAYNARTSITLNGQTYNFSSVTGKVKFIMCGHLHTDLDGTLGGIPIIGVTNLKHGSTPSFDMCLVDYAANKVYCVRVGSGTDRTFNI